MIKPNRVAVLSLVVLTMACVLLPARSNFDRPAPPNTPEESEPSSELVGSPVAADSAVSVPIHAGHGVRGNWFEIYFTDPSAPASRQTTGGIDESLVDAIDAARLSVHLAMYNLSLNDVRASLLRAKRRGVDVRLVAESDNLDGDDFQRLIAAGIPVLGDRRKGTMHDKFMIIDGTEVWTGSMNYTVSGTYSDNNCVVHLRSAALAVSYEAEFSEMFDLDQFGDHGPVSPAAAPLDIEGSSVQVFFAPDNHPEATIVDLLKRAHRSIHFLAYSFTSDPLGDAVRDAKRAGLDVQGVMDTDQAAFNIGSELADFRAAGLDVRLDGNPGLMHEKVFVIDDQIVVVGSYNFSRSANESNDENLLVIDNPIIAHQFALEFDRVFALASR